MKTLHSRFAVRKQRGFSIVEVLIAVAILFFGMLAVLALFGIAIADTQNAQQDLIMKQKAREALEVVYGARDAGIPFAQIDNVPAGIFLNGWDNLVRVAPNSAGILGTGTEGGAPDYELAPDAAGNLNVQVPLTNYQRRITIAPFVSGGVNDPNLKIITVDVRTTLPNGKLVIYTATGYVSSFR